MNQDILHLIKTVNDHGNFEQLLVLGHLLDESHMTEESVILKTTISLHFPENDIIALDNYKNPRRHVDAILTAGKKDANETYCEDQENGYFPDRTL